MRKNGFKKDLPVLPAGVFFHIIYKLKAEIALAEAAPVISAFQRTQLTCKLILN